MKKRIAATISLFCILLALAQINSSNSAPLTLDISTNKSLYDIGESITVNGSLTLDGTPVSNGLVSIEIIDPQNDSYIVRVLNTSQTVNVSMPIEISQFFPCDSSGDPKYSFKVGLSVNVGFKFTISNKQASTLYVVAILTIIYSNNVPCELKSFSVFSGTIEPRQNITRTMWPVPLTSPPLGTAKAYLDVLTDWPKDNGFALCPEKSTTFTISSTMSSELQDLGTQEQILDSTPGTFTLSFKVNPFGGVLGHYTIYADAFVYPNFATADASFDTYLLGDITGSVPGVKDGKCDMKDISAVAKQFGQSVPPAPSYCDVVIDGKVDMKDISAAARDFGKWGVLP